MSDSIARLPYTLSELQSLLSRLNTIDNEFDGEWVKKYEAHATNAISPIGNPEDPTKEVSWDLSNYLPNDTYSYELSLNICSSTCFATVHTLAQSTNFWTADSTCLDSAKAFRSFINIEVNQDRKLYVKNYASTSGYYDLEFLGYRRLGKHPAQS